MKLIKLVLWLLHTNCYILFDETTKNGVLIDPAGECNVIIDKLEEFKINLKYIILTHGHIDHMIALDELKEKTNAKIVIHKDDVVLLENADCSLATHFKKPQPKSNADVVVNDNDTLKVDENTFKFIHTPGHTPGGMCILYENFLFSGDTLFANSVGRVDHFGGDMELEVLSIKEKLLILDDEIIVYPGHGTPTTIGNERKNNMFLM